MTTLPQRPTRTPVQQAARLANIWGWSYILTVLGAVGAWAVPPGPLRVLLLNFGILCFAIGAMELFWRKKLLATGEARWVRILALNEVGGTLALFWSLHLLYQVPVALLYDYAQHSELWTRSVAVMRTWRGGSILTEEYLLQTWQNTKMLAVYGLGGLLFLSQVWVIIRYLGIARAVARAPAVPPVL